MDWHIGGFSKGYHRVLCTPAAWVRLTYYICHG